MGSSSPAMQDYILRSSCRLWSLPIERRARREGAPRRALGHLTNSDLPTATESFEHGPAILEGRRRIAGRAISDCRKRQAAGGVKVQEVAEAV